MGRKPWGMVRGVFWMVHLRQMVWQHQTEAGGKHKCGGEDLQEVLAYQACCLGLLILVPRAHLNKVSQGHLNYLMSTPCQQGKLGMTMSRNIYHSEVRLPSFCVDTLRPQWCTRTSTAMALCLGPVRRHGETVSQGWLGCEGCLGKVSKNNDETIDKHIEECLSCGCRIYSIVEPL